jgi:Flp pilus assembly protein TadG
MLKPLIRRSGNNGKTRSNERGFTMALVTVALVAIIGMAALSIDIGTLYQAKAEAQRAADVAALAAARVISLSGITADPNGYADGTWAAVCGGSTNPATLTAQSVAQQNTIAGVAPTTVTVKYSASSSTTTFADCSSLGAEFAINPVVNVTVTQPNLPIFFARVFSLMGMNYAGSSVTANASAEAYNPSGSGGITGPVNTPVVPRCVKPWIIGNSDPISGGNPFVYPVSGVVVSQGVDTGTSTVGETFNLVADCNTGGSSCTIPATGNNPPQYRASFGGEEYIPAAILGTPGAVPSCASSDLYQQAIGGCDQTTPYACGVLGGTSIDLADYNPGGATGDTSTATQCLIHQSGTSGGEDTLVPGTTPPFPFQIQAGAANPLVTAALSPGVSAGNTITASDSIATIPIAQFSVPVTNPNGTVTIVGFLQVFINSVNTLNGYVSVTVLNVSGCGNSSTGTPIVQGSSPVPVRLITPP